MKTNQEDSNSAIEEVFPYLCVRGAASAIDFYAKAFGAAETFRISDPEGRIGHAQLKFGPTIVMLADEYPESGIQSPLAFGGTGSTIHLHVRDVDEMTKKAVEAGATVLMPPTNQPHGERQCRLRDPFGHEWLLGHQVENVPLDEMQQRYNAQLET